MHPRNPYRVPPDFQALAKSYPPLTLYLKGRIINFQDDAAQRCLTQALLKADFNLTLSLPPHRLCPPVPNRLNYVLWVQDIVAAHEVVFCALAKGKSTGLAVWGVDVGTGASAIYPLLACTLKTDWRFIATELDDESYQHAVKNIRTNNLSSRIKIVKVSPSTESQEKPSFNFDNLFQTALADTKETIPEPLSGKLLHEPADSIQFTICNPPFYGSADEILLSAAGKEEGPFGACTGAPAEMVTPGGESAFVCAMVRESTGTRAALTASKRGMEESGGCQLGRPDNKTKRRRLCDDGPRFQSAPQEQWADQVGLEECFVKPLKSRWYTSMLGKLSSVADVVTAIKNYGLTNYAITEFVQGQTRRWAVGWSSGPWRLPDTIARIPHPNSVLMKLMPPQNALRFTLPPLHNVAVATSTPATLCAPSILWMQRLISVINGIEGLSTTSGIQETGIPEEHIAKLEEGCTDRLGKKLFISVARNTWSRHARRKTKINKGNPEEKGGDPGRHLPAMICCISILDVGQNPAAGMAGELVFQWIYGWQRSLFESFSGHVAGRVIRG